MLALPPKGMKDCVPLMWRSNHEKASGRRVGLAGGGSPWDPTCRRGTSHRVAGIRRALLLIEPAHCATSQAACLQP